MHAVEYAGEKAFPYLWELMGGTFHQDVIIYGDTLEKVLAHVRGEATADFLSGTKADIDRFLRERPNDMRVDEDMQAFFSPDCGS